MASKMLRIGNGVRGISRVLALKSVQIKPSGIQTKRNASHYKSDWCDAHMNELPVPCGPWDEFYADKQSFFMKHLVVGALWFAFSVFMVFYTDCIFFNWTSPERPGPPSDMVEECVEEEE